MASFTVVLNYPAYLGAPEISINAFGARLTQLTKRRKLSGLGKAGDEGGAQTSAGPLTSPTGALEADRGYSLASVSD